MYRNRNNIDVVIFYVYTLVSNWMWWEFIHDNIFIYFYNVFKSYMWLVVILDNNISLIHKVIYLCVNLFYDIMIINSFHIQNIFKVLSIIYSVYTIYTKSTIPTNDIIIYGIQFMIFAVLILFLHKFTKK